MFKTWAKTELLVLLGVVDIALISLAYHWIDSDSDQLVTAGLVLLPTIFFGSLAIFLKIVGPFNKES